MNIVNMLEGCPQGTKLYSVIHGEVTLQYVNRKLTAPIVTKNLLGSECCFYEDGRPMWYEDSECILFPSKDNRDWSTFQAPPDTHIFKPFEKVLVRDHDDDVWHCTFFSHYGAPNTYKYHTVSVPYLQCIPFAGNEHLLNTTNKPSN